MDSGSKGWGFESLRARYLLHKVSRFITLIFMNETQELVAETNETQATITSGDSVQDWFSKNLKIVIGIIGVAVLGVAGYYLYSSMQEGSEKESALALSRIKPYIDRNEWQKALDGDQAKKVRGNDIVGLKSIVEEYGSTQSGKVAALYAGNALFTLKKYSEAEEYFEKASNSSSDVIELGGKAGLASCKEAQNKVSEAATEYEALIPIAEKIGSKDRYQFLAALCYEKSGNKEKAEKLYRNLLAEFEESEFSGEAKSGLIRLGTIVE